MWIDKGVLVLSCQSEIADHCTSVAPKGNQFTLLNPYQRADEREHTSHGLPIRNAEPVPNARTGSSETQRSSAEDGKRRAPRKRKRIERDSEIRNGQDAAFHRHATASPLLHHAWAAFTTWFAETGAASVSSALASSIAACLPASLPSSKPALPACPLAETCGQPAAPLKSSLAVSETGGLSLPTVNTMSCASAKPCESSAHNALQRAPAGPQAATLCTTCRSGNTQVLEGSLQSTWDSGQSREIPDGSAVQITRRADSCCGQGDELPRAQRAKHGCQICGRPMQERLPDRGGSQPPQLDHILDTSDITYVPPGTCWRDVHRAPPGGPLTPCTLSTGTTQPQRQGQAVMSQTGANDGLPSLFSRAEFETVRAEEAARKEGKDPGALDLIQVAAQKVAIRPKFCFWEAGRGWGRRLRLFDNVVANEAPGERLARAHDTVVVIPRGSRFLLSDVTRLDPLYEGSGYHCIVLDPPWENASARRSKAYPVLPSRNLLGIQLPHLMAQDGCLVALWVTNRERILRSVERDLFPAWGLRRLATWYWLKITDRGQIVGPLDIMHRRPYEALILAAPEAHTQTQPQVPDGVVILAVPGEHSRKPHLGRLLRPLSPGGPSPRCLEMFARELAAEWTSWGNEVLRFQTLHHWESTDRQ